MICSTVQPVLDHSKSQGRKDSIHRMYYGLGLTFSDHVFQFDARRKVFNETDLFSWLVTEVIDGGVSR